MSRGKRYNGEAKLNMKKVLAVLVALLVIVMFVFVIYKLVTNGKGERMTNNYYFTSFQDNKYGVITDKCEEVIAPSYREYIVIPNNKTDIFLCTYDVDYTNNTYKTKALNSKNKEIFTEYENIEPIANYDANNTISYEQNAIKVQKDGKYGMINIEGKEILPCEYDDLYSLKNTSNKVGVISSEGETILNNVYDDVKFAFTGSYIIEQNGKYGIAKSKDEIVVNPTYTTMNYISTADIIEASEDGITSNLLNSNFEIKLTGIVTEINTNKGYIKIRQDNEEKYYNFRFEERTKQDINSSNTLFLDKQNDKYGYVDKNGKVVVDYQYDDATEQNEYGYAAVQKDGKWGAINEKGEEIVAPQYDFSNNLGIDFIGEWHLGSIDSNATYYTK